MFWLGKDWQIFWPRYFEIERNKFIVLMYVHKYMNNHIMKITNAHIFENLNVIINNAEKINYAHFIITWF